MPLKPRRPGESKSKFLGDCISELVNAGHAQDQAAAICYQQMDVQLVFDKKWRNELIKPAGDKIKQMFK